MKNSFLSSAKEVALSALFVAMLVVAQLSLSFVPGVEIVTLLFVAYAYLFGVVRSMLCATAFSLLRCFVFGFFPTVIILYLIYYNFLVVVFALWGKYEMKRHKNNLILTVVLACVCTVIFTLIDDVLTPVWYGYTKRATLAYFRASIPFMAPQVACSGITVGLLFRPVCEAFHWANPHA